MTSLRALGARVESVALDVTDAASVAAAFDEAATALGPITVVVNNAGIAITKPLLDHTEEDWQQVIDVNLNGAWRVAQAAARHMVAHGRAAASSTSRRSSACACRAQVPSYAASKAALIQLDQGDGARARAPPDPRQRAGARLRRDRHQSRLLRERSGPGADQARAAAPDRQARRARRRAAAARVRRRLVHDRRGASPSTAATSSTRCDESTRGISRRYTCAQAAQALQSVVEILDQVLRILEPDLQAQCRTARIPARDRARALGPRRNHQALEPAPAPAEAEEAHAVEHLRDARRRRPAAARRRTGPTRRGNRASTARGRDRRAAPDRAPRALPAAARATSRSRARSPRGARGARRACAGRAGRGSNRRTTA